MIFRFVWVFFFSAICQKVFARENCFLLEYVLHEHQSISSMFSNVPGLKKVSKQTLINQDYFIGELSLTVKVKDSLVFNEANAALAKRSAVLFPAKPT